MDHATTMRSAYERINAGDIDGFGDLLADEFVEHEEIPGLSPTKEGVLVYFGVVADRVSLTCGWMSRI